MGKRFWTFSRAIRPAMASGRGRRDGRALRNEGERTSALLLSPRRRLGDRLAGADLTVDVCLQDPRGKHLPRDAPTCPPRLAIMAPTSHGSSLRETHPSGPSSLAPFRGGPVGATALPSLVTPPRQRSIPIQPRVTCRNRASIPEAGDLLNDVAVGSLSRRNGIRATGESASSTSIPPSPRSASGISRSAMEAGTSIDRARSSSSGSGSTASRSRRSEIGRLRHRCRSGGSRCRDAAPGPSRRAGSGLRPRWHCRRASRPSFGPRGPRGRAVTRCPQLPTQRTRAGSSA